MMPAIQSQQVEVRHKLPPLRTLTAIRFFAAIYVVLFHESHWDGHIPFFPFAARVIQSGYTAVTLFFVLSGFILAYNYPSVRSRKQFWIARFARIYPLYFLSLLPPLLITPHWSYHPRPGTLGVVLTLLLLQAWWPPLAFSLNMAAWTLSVEAFFYLTFPFLLPWIESLRKRTFLAIQLAYLLLLCLPPLLSLYPATTLAGFHLAGWLEGTVPLARLNAFVLGMYVGVLFRRSATRRLDAAPTPTARASKRWLLIPAFLIPLALLSLAPSTLYLPLRTGILQLSYALLLPLLAEVQWPILTNHPMQMAGEISYGIYVIQFPVLFAYNDLVNRLFPGSVHISLLYILTLIVFAYLTFRWIEIPARFAIRNLFSRRPVPVRPI